MDIQAKFYPGGTDVNVHGAVCHTCNHVDVVSLIVSERNVNREVYGWVIYDDITQPYTIHNMNVTDFNDACNYCDYWVNHQKMETDADGKKIPAYDFCVKNYIKSRQKKD